MEPERKIEKVLRAFAKKRRDEAGPPMEMHPATRRLLQGEITRQSPKTERESSESSPRGFRLIELLAVIAIIAIFAAMLMPALSRAKSKSSRVAKMQEERQQEIKRQLEAADDAAAARPAATPAPEPSRKRGENERLEAKTESGTKSVIAGSEVSVSNGNADVPSQVFSVTNSGSIAIYDETLRTAQTNGLPAVTSTAATLAESDVKRRMDTSGSFADKSKLDTDGRSRMPGEAGVAQKFFRVQVPDKVPASPSVSNSPVLVAFTLEQSNGLVRVVDSDGSVYAGRLLPAFLVNSPEVANRESAVGGQRSIDALGKDVNGQTAYTFEVSGTNRSLNQNVVFSGSVGTVINGLTSVQRTNGLGAPVPPASVPPSSGLQIRGTAVIDDASRVEILAVPAVPPN